MPAVLADGRRRVRLLTTKPNDPAAVTASEANAGIKAECRILKSDYTLGATGSETVNDAVLCAEGNAVTFGASNYEGSMTPIRYFTPDGQVDVEGKARPVELEAGINGAHLRLLSSGSGARRKAPAGRRRRRPA